MPLILWTIKHQPKKHHTSLHHLANIAGFRPDEMEKMAATRQCLGTTPKYLTFIAASKEESIETDKELFPTSRMIYTDSSGFKGAIGAAAVAFTNGIKKAELQYQLSSITKHMVFKGELVAIILGLHLSRYVLGTPGMHQPQY